MHSPATNEYSPRPPPKGDINAVPWIPEAADPLVFTNANVVDVEGSRLLEDHSLVIVNGFVQSVEPSANTKTPKGARVIDCRDLYLCPGLADCHVHINMCDGRREPYTEPTLRATYTLKCMLARGFTSVRDVGGADYFQKLAIEQWLTPGPRLFQGGKMLSQTGGHGDGRARQVDSMCCTSFPGTLVDGVPEALREARATMRKGADHIKICTSGGVSTETDKLEGVQFRPEEIRAIADVVRDMGGTGVTSHAYTVPAIRRAIENGVRGIEHGNLLDRDTAKLMAKLGTFLTPTLMISTAKSRPPWNETLPEYMREKNARVQQQGRVALKIADEEGVCISFDLTFGMGYLQSEEFVQRSQILPSHKVLAHATINAAKNLADERIGVLKKGAYGDVLVLKSNPLEDVCVLDSGAKGILGVVKDGRVVVARGSIGKQVRVDVALNVQEAE